MASSDERRSSVKMEPIPQSSEALKDEVRKFQLHPRSNDNPSPRAQLCLFMKASEQIKRSPCHTSILLVGISGVGKSSTINHFLKTGDAVQSETKDTSEFILTVDEPKYEVSDLQLGIVDTPGFSDTDGLEQAACNFYSIKKFYETHPKLSGCFPNLFFLLVQATDTRIEGPNSHLSQSLRCLTQLGLVDQIHPNIVVVLSFCCSIPHNNVVIWEKKMQKKKAIIQRIVFDVLNVTAPVVMLENNYDEWGLEVVGDFTRLPNGELQPKNLYNACKEVLKANSDDFALMTLTACFDKPLKKGPTTGHETKAKNTNEEIFNAEQEKIVKLVQNVSEGVTVDPIIGIVNLYVKDKGLNDEEEYELQRLACSLKRMGLKDMDDCASISKGSVEYFHENEISWMGAKMLEEKFGIKKKAVVLSSGDLVGQGYNILTDRPTSTQIMAFKTEEKDFGFILPICAEVEKVNHTRSFQELIEDKKSYVQSRLSHLNVNLDVQIDIFKMGARPGFNRSRNCSGESSNSGHSVLHECRMFKVKIAKFKEKKNGITFTSDFVTDVKRLPDEYDRDDPGNRKCFERFFTRFGHFIVSSAYGGGAVEMTVSEESLKNEASSPTATSKSCMEQSKVREWFGGISALCTEDTFDSQEKMLKWKTSLLVKPTLLNTEMDLEPISTVIGCIDDGKITASYDALEDLLGGKFKLLACKEEEEKDRNKKITEEERSRDEASTRSRTVEDPPKTGWCQMLIEIAIPIVFKIGLILILQFI